jgi:hypothetical protein
MNDYSETINQNVHIARVTSEWTVTAPADDNNDTCG